MYQALPRWLQGGPMSQNISSDKCRRMIFDIGLALGVSPKLISTRLLSKQDKDDMLAGELTKETLTSHVSIWNKMGMLDYSEGSCEPYRSKIIKT